MRAAPDLTLDFLTIPVDGGQRASHHVDAGTGPWGGRSGFLMQLKVDERVEGVLIARRKSGGIRCRSTRNTVIERGQSGQNPGARRAGVGIAIETVMDQLRDPPEPFTHLGGDAIALRPSGLGPLDRGGRAASGNVRRRAVLGRRFPRMSAWCSCPMTTCGSAPPRRAQVVVAGFTGCCPPSHYSRPTSRRIRSSHAD